VTKKQSREDIGRIAREFFGFPLDMKISLDAAKDEPPASQGNAQIKTSSFIDNEIEKEPIIQTVLDVFDGELIG
jgi:hypothetical protein